MKTFFLPGKKEDEFTSSEPVVFKLLEIDPFFYELFKGLRAKVEHRIDMVGLRVLAVTSAVAGEGKTLTSIYLSATMASTGRRKVLLLDLDLRKSGIAMDLGIAPYPGMGEFLLGSVPMEKIIRKSAVPGLYVIPGGRPIPSPADMLAGEKFRSFLLELRGQFDLVVLDTPPVLPAPDALTISEQVDAFILLFRLGQTPYPLLRQAVEEIGERKIMGVVLNGEEKKSDKYYSRYYGKYYKSVGKEEKKG